LSAVIGQYFGGFDGIVGNQVCQKLHGFGLRHVIVNFNVHILGRSVYGNNKSYLRMRLIAPSGLLAGKST
jgi:hypothetical protein